jgi:peptide/nickel transport system substrate-binding protein
MEEIFEYRFTRLDPVGGDHIDPPSVAIYETLLQKGSGDAPLPGLAASWQVLDGGLTWRLRLREGAVFHSGAPCDARAVVTALNRCRWGDGRTRQLWYWDPVDRVTAADAETVEVRLHYPYLGLPTLLWGTHTAICNDRMRCELGDRFGVVAADGTGPYRLVAFSPQEVIAERGQTRIRWRSMPLEADRLAVLADGSADVVRAVPGSGLDQTDWAGQADQERWRICSQPEISQFYLGLNFDDPRGFGELDFRRAVDGLVDRDALVRAAFGGHGDGRRSPVPAGDRYAESYDLAAVPPLTSAQAEAVLDRLGFVRGADGVRARDGQSLHLDCVTQEAEPFRRLAAELAGQLERAGIVLRFRYEEPFEAFYRAVEARPAAFLSKWLWPDSVEAIMGFSRSSCAGDGGCNWQGARLPAVDAAYDRFLESATVPEAQAASRAVQETFMRELPYVPLCSPQETYAISPRVTGFWPVSGTLYPLYDQVDVRP